MNFVWFVLFSYCVVGFVVGVAYSMPDKEVKRARMSDDKLLARGILLIPFWLPVGIYAMIKGLIVGTWWVLTTAFKKEN